jgi:hypothetical protein
MIRKGAFLPLLVVLVLALTPMLFAEGQGEQGGGQAAAGEDQPLKQAPDVWGDEVNILTLKSTVPQPLFHFGEIWEEERGRGTTVKVTEVPI